MGIDIGSYYTHYPDWTFGRNEERSKRVINHLIRYHSFGRILLDQIEIILTYELDNNAVAKYYSIAGMMVAMYDGNGLASMACAVEVAEVR